MTASIYIYFFLVFCVAFQRLVEVRIAGRNTSRLLSMGAKEFKSGHYNIMKALHTTWLLACLAEAFIRQRPPSVEIATVGLVLFAIGQSLRIAAMLELGVRWTTRIIVLPEAPPIAGGIYRIIKHPNYLGVILEIAALPLVFGCWWTAGLYSVANLVLLLAVRIPAEERAITAANSGPGLDDWIQRGRFLPGKA